MNKPRVWTTTELENASIRAIKTFREERMREPLEKYIEIFEGRRSAVEDLLEHLVDMTDVDLIEDQTIVDILSKEESLEAFRYLSCTPVSKDDLTVLAEVPSLAPKTLTDPEMARIVFQTVLQGLDPCRFPWVRAKREPTEPEKHAAIIASAALMAAQRVATDRRNEGKTAQEGSVMQALEEIDFTKVDAREISNFDDAPEPGEFCPESKICGCKADVVVRLYDRRLLAIECKVSNSSTNSIKRLNEAEAKASIWTKRLGSDHLEPSAVLSGVFKLRNLLDAQKKGLALWWAHDLESFQKWVKAARNKGK